MKFRVSLLGAIDFKLRLEKSLENEKTEGKRKSDDLQARLEQERKDREKDESEANSKYDSLNAKFAALQVEELLRSFVHYYCFILEFLQFFHFLHIPSTA